MKRQLIVILLGLALTAALPTTVGTHPVTGGDDAGTGQDAPDRPVEAIPLEEGAYEGDLLPPLDTADWYVLTLHEERDLFVELASDLGVRLVVDGPNDGYSDAAGHQTVRFDRAAAGNWTIGVLSDVPLPAHYFLALKAAPIGDDHHHDHGDAPEPLPDEGANGTITQEDPYDAYILDAAAFEYVRVTLEASPHAGIALKLRALDGHQHHAHDGQKAKHDDRHHLHDGTAGEWIAPYDTTLLVEVFLIHEYLEECDMTGCKTYEKIGEGGDYTLSVHREENVTLPDLAVTDIKEERRPIRTDLTPDVPNAVNERRTIVVEVTNIGEGDAWFPSYAFIMVRDDNGPWFGGAGEATDIHPLESGASTTVEFEWDTTTSVGDYTIEAHVLPSPGWFDTDMSNNRAESETFVKVGGLV